jgi:hypothetical protein
VVVLVRRDAGLNVLTAMRFGAAGRRVGVFRFLSARKVIVDVLVGQCSPEDDWEALENCPTCSNYEERHL